MPRTIAVTDLEGLAGEHLGYSDWHEITQEQVNTFADATGDHQWIHVDVEKAKSSPFGGPIAHGYLTMSLAPVLMAEIWSVTGTNMGVNYGLNKMRLPAPVPVGSKLRLGATLVSARQRPGGFVEVVTGLRFEVEGSDKPVCTAETVTLLRPDTA